MTPVLLAPRLALPGATAADRDVLVVDPHRRPRAADLVVASTAALAVGAALLVAEHLEVGDVVLGVVAAVHRDR